MKKHHHACSSTLGCAIHNEPFIAHYVSCHKVPRQTGGSQTGGSQTGGSQTGGSWQQHCNYMTLYASILYKSDLVQRLTHASIIHTLKWQRSLSGWSSTKWKQAGLGACCACYLSLRPYVLYAVDKGLRGRNVLQSLLLILLRICSRSVRPILTSSNEPLQHHDLTLCTMSPQ